MRIPRRFMTDKLDLYTATVTNDSSGYSRTLAITPSHTDVACMYQPATSQTIEEYDRRELQVSGSVYLVNTTVFNAMAKSDRVVVDSVNYEIIGKKDLAGRHRVYRVDILEEAE